MFVSSETKTAIGPRAKILNNSKADFPDFPRSIKFDFIHIWRRIHIIFEWTIVNIIYII